MHLVHDYIGGGGGDAVPTPRDKKRKKQKGMVKNSEISSYIENKFISVLRIEHFFFIKKYKRKKN